MGLCERCKKAPSTFHITRIDPNGEKAERHLCDRCSIEEGHVQVEKPVSATQLDDFIKVAAHATANLVCDECGLSYLEFRNQGPLGCPHDYDAFKEELAPLIERAHDGGTHHVGKTPRSVGRQRTTEQDIHALRRQLEDAVAAEDYERAAKLRDRIQKMEQR